MKHRCRFDTDLSYTDVGLAFETRMIFFDFQKGSRAETAVLDTAVDYYFKHSHSINTSKA